MVDLLTGNWRIRRGTWTEVDMTATYDVRSFPRQADQRIGWKNPVDPSAALSEVAEIVEAFDGSRGGDGDIEFSWTFNMLTPLMVKYLRQTLFNENFSDAFTVMTWDRGYGWRVVNCTGGWNDPAKSAEQPGGWHGYSALTINFVAGTIAEVGNALELENGLEFQLETGDILLLE